MCEGLRIKNRPIRVRSRRAALARRALGFIGASLLILLAGVACFADPQASSPSIIKVEPPSWWANHTINPVRLLIRGKNLSGARVRTTRPQTVVSDVRINPSGTYLFVNLRISSSAQPGEYPLMVETAQGRATVAFHINAALDSVRNLDRKSVV